MNIGVLLLLVLVSGLFVIGRLSSAPRLQDAPGNLSVDLPCPWCNGATKEIDTSCPSCGQTFGS